MKRRLHGARRARGTSLCPGHILLFGHVKMLILSLLSKSLPIKGREARPAAHPGKCKALNHPEDLWTHCYGRFTRLCRLLKSTTPVLQCSHARSASTVVTRPWWAATRPRPTTAVSRPWTRYARRDFARKMGFSGPNGPHRKPPLRGGMLRMSWRYAPWSTRLVGFQKPARRTRPQPHCRLLPWSITPSCLPTTTNNKLVLILTRHTPHGLDWPTARTRQA